MTDQQQIIRLSAALTKSNLILTAMAEESKKEDMTKDERRILAQLQCTILNNDKLLKEVME